MKARNILMAVVLLCTAAATAQTNEQINESRRQYYYNYSRWSIGVNGGLSALFGDFSTFSSEKFYPAPIVSASVGYQMNPSVGFTLEGYYSQNKIGALGSNENDYLNTNGYYSPVQVDPLTGETFLPYGNLYSKVKLWQGRLGLDLNLSNLFGGKRDDQMRRFTLIFSPSYYLQYYRPEVFIKGNDQRYTSRDLFYQVNSAVGAELAARFRMSRVVDLQLKGGGAYGFNKKFDGVAGDKKTNILAYVQAGIVFKLNGKTLRDNLMYAATPKHVPMMDLGPMQDGPEMVVEKVVHDTVVVYKDRIVEKPVVKTVAYLPNIGFERGKAVIDTKKYENELGTIVKFMKENPDVDVDIVGWADHTGSDNLNANLTTQRAEALRDYLTSQGISASRIKSAIGKGKDMNLSGEDALSVKARRAETLVK